MDNCFENHNKALNGLCRLIVENYNAKAESV